MRKSEIQDWFRNTEGAFEALEASGVKPHNKLAVRMLCDDVPVRQIAEATGLTPQGVLMNCKAAKASAHRRMHGPAYEQKVLEGLSPELISLPIGIEIRRVICIAARCGFFDGTEAGLREMLSSESGLRQFAKFPNMGPLRTQEVLSAMSIKATVRPAWFLEKMPWPIKVRLYPWRA